MLKIVANHNHQNITYSYTQGQAFPDVKGKLLSVELNGNELAKLMEVKEIPINAADTCYLVWYGKHAGGVLKTLREIFSK